MDGSEAESQNHNKRRWKFENVVDWFETEGSVFNTLGGPHKGDKLRVVVASQGENRVIESICKYLERFGFHPCFRSTRYIVKKGLLRTRSAECELLRGNEQICFLRQCLPLLRTEKRRREVRDAIEWLEPRLKSYSRWYKKFKCPSLK